MSPAATSVVDLPAVFRTVASSTWVVTTTAPDGTPVGFTAISIASVSLDPPLISFNVSRTSSSLPALTASRRCAVHLLAHDQELLARRFAGPAAHRFDDEGAWGWDEAGVPQLQGAAARLSGAVTAFVEAGDSLLVLAAVEDTRVTGRAPLVHHARAYHRLPAPGTPTHAA
ncbi:flavin reductase family protein [Quadrisphaera sp. DSM 44207]|uniref:flavin reductase family protein n=1 Tax=Quadrisphaera sp. DSM 44207 TaxID=1881057 RepID=UPI00088392F5|nr:flavin reductase family protein [Quadrisphaera sp. DSM 44207]SDQ64221.1 NADH-FMN oxidoreductase RutF, flavin reductase (DIM6/NTAB) family [Quadrisphaera sp. DSM 44207]